MLNGTITIKKSNGESIELREFSIKQNFVKYNSQKVDNIKNIANEIESLSSNVTKIDATTSVEHDVSSKFNISTKEDEQRKQYLENEFFAMRYQDMYYNTCKKLQALLYPSALSSHYDALNNDIVYKNTNNDDLKEALEIGHFKTPKGEKPKELLKEYLNELDKLLLEKKISLSPSVYEEYKMSYTFPHYTEMFEYDKSLSLLTDIPCKNYTDRAPELFKAFFLEEIRLPRHIAFLVALKSLFPNNDFLINKIETENSPFPIYVIKMHINSEDIKLQDQNVTKIFKSDRDFILQVSNEKGTTCYIDNGGNIPIELPLFTDIKNLKEYLMMLLTQPPIDSKIRQEYIDTMLIIGTMNRDLESVKKFLALGANPTKTINVDLKNLLNFMVSNMKVLTEQSSSQNLKKNEKIENKRYGLLKTTPIELYAFAKYYAEEIPREYGIDKKHDIDPAILVACHKDLLMQKLEYFSELITLENTTTLKDVNIEIVKELLDSLKQFNADINTTYNSTSIFPYWENVTPLFFAVINSNYELAKFLIENGADVNMMYSIKKKESGEFCFQNLQSLQDRVTDKSDLDKQFRVILSFSDAINAQADKQTILDFAFDIEYKKLLNLEIELKAEQALFSEEVRNGRKLDKKTFFTKNLNMRKLKAPTKYDLIERIKESIDNFPMIKLIVDAMGINIDEFEKHIHLTH